MPLTASGQPYGVGKAAGRRARFGSDVELLALLLRWAPAIIIVTGVAGVVMGLVAVSHDRAEVQLIGASVVLTAVVSAVLALTFVLLARTALAQWQDAPRTSPGTGSDAGPRDRPAAAGDGRPGARPLRA